MTKVAIVGAGEIGGFLAERLSAERFEVTVIDRNAEMLASLQNTTDVAVVHGDATSIKQLAEAPIAESDYFIATTRQDETNVIACLLAHELGIAHKIAVTRYLGQRGQRRPFDSKPLGIDLMVNSSEAVKNEIMDILETSGAAEVATFAQGRIIMVGCRVDERSAFCDRSIEEFTRTAGAEPAFHVVAIVRRQALVPPLPGTIVQAEDYLYLISTQAHLHELNAILQVDSLASRTAVIYGDNFLSQLVAGALLSRHYEVTMLVSNEDKARFLKEHFRLRRHFHVETGDGTEVKLLRRVKVPATSVFIATKSEDVNNLTACMIAKHLGVPKTIAMIKRNDMLPLCRNAGVDANVAPRLATAKVIQRMIHEHRVLDYRAVSQTNLEAVELEARADSKPTLVALGDLKLPEGATIGGIVSEGKPLLPSPAHRLRPGDTVIVLTPPESLVEIEGLFGS